MRTKTLLLSAVLGIVGAASVVAQNTVYSVNAVGYVNLPIPVGFSLIANPLDAAPNNNLATLFPSATLGTKVYRFTNGAFDIATFEQDDFGVNSWGDKGTMPLNPGEGFFIKATTAFTNTFVGTVPQGTLNNALPSGFSLKSSIVPQEGRLDTVLKFPAQQGDKVYKFVNGAYAISTFETDDFGNPNWDTAPIVKVGEGFWLRTGAARTWTRNFDVNNPNA